MIVITNHCDWDWVTSGLLKFLINTGFARNIKIELVIVVEFLESKSRHMPRPAPENKVSLAQVCLKVFFDCSFISTYERIEK